MFHSVLFCDILQLGGVAEMEAQYGKQIRKMRKAHNLTQEEFAKKSNISMMSLRRYETNERQPNMQILSQMATALNMSLQKFLWSDPETGDSYFWTRDLENKLVQVGCKLGYDEDNAFLCLDFPDGYLEVSEDELKELHKSTNEFMRFKLLELKQNHPEDFREIKKR